MTGRATLALAGLFTCVVGGAAACGSERMGATSNPNGDAEADIDASSSGGGPGGDASGGVDGTSTPPSGDAEILLLGDASTDGARTCVPATGCPAGVHCGRYVDPCGGGTFACGSACPSGQVCTTTGENPPTQACQPKACAGKCGVVAVDSCGVAVSCGGCPTGEDCVGNQCLARSSAPPPDAGAADACGPLTCDPNAQTHLCGSIHDSCGHTVSCSCAAGEQCVAGVCSAPPPECSTDAGTRCGSVANACGSGNIACGSCTGASQCVAGACQACTPPTCGTATCGSVNNGCGPAVSCGTCPSGEQCSGGSCCKPMTCAAAMDAGLVTGCGQVDLGCGVKQSCETCGAGMACVSGTCQACAPKTCADFGNAGCGHADGCGKTLNCCAAGESCQSGLCCAPGEVNYNGSCCLPQCDLDQPPGTQVSCGQVLYCTGGGSGSSSSGGSSGSLQ